MEFVLVVPRGDLFRGQAPRGLARFRTSAEVQGFRETVREKGFFVERDYAERTPSLKQIIPYSILCAEGSVLLMRRLPRGGEQRLHGKLSIGVGGHIDPTDLEPDGTRDGLLEAAARREISEELEVRGSYETHPIGLLNDDSNPVGAVHLGWVQVVITAGSVRIREEDVLDGRLVSVEELKRSLRDGEDFESWSTILIAELDRLSLHTPLATLR
jgi:predicted NUDIX family phosphoesterase